MKTIFKSLLDALGQGRRPSLLDDFQPPPRRRDSGGFGLNGTPARDAAADAKAALKRFGLYRPSGPGTGPYPDAALFDGSIPPDPRKRQEPPQPWWRSTALPRISAEAFQSNRRTLDGLLRYKDNGGLPELFAGAVRDYGTGAKAEVADFLRQLHGRDPDRVRGLEKEVFDKLDGGVKSRLFKDVFGDGSGEPPAAERTALAQGGGALSGKAGRNVPEWPRMSAQAKPPGSLMAAPLEPPQPKHTVPAYRKQAVPQRDLDDFMAHHKGGGANLNTAVAEICGSAWNTDPCYGVIGVQN